MLCRYKALKTALTHTHTPSLPLSVSLSVRLSFAAALNFQVEIETRAQLTIVTCSTRRIWSHEGFSLGFRLTIYSLSLDDLLAAGQGGKSIPAFFIENLSKIFNSFSSHRKITNAFNPFGKLLQFAAHNAKFSSTRIELQGSEAVRARAGLGGFAQKGQPIV